MVVNFFDANLLNIVLQPLSLFWSSASRTEVGKVRKKNEDAYLELLNRGLWVVADGMGGHDTGEVASAEIVKTLAQFSAPIQLSRSIDEIEDRLQETNLYLRKLARATRQDCVIGATVVAMFAYGSFVVYLWAGDCRLYRYRNGKLVQLTQDHTQVEDMVANGLLTRLEARRHPNANIVTRAIGAREVLFLDADIEPVLPGDRFLLCSDGLDKELNDIEIRDLVANGGDREALNSLVNLALSRKARDNITVIVATAHLDTPEHMQGEELSTN
ncbi:PPM family protein phosphatase [Gammaproteobacteria bacterium]